jgi:hypothetical protein
MGLFTGTRPVDDAARLSAFRRRRRKLDADVEISTRDRRRTFS